MKKYVITLFAAILLSPNVTAQLRTAITGMVRDGNSGESIPGALVYTEDKKASATSDYDGRYKLEIQGFPVTLVCSMAGYEDNVKILSADDGKRNCDFVLNESKEMIEASKVLSASGKELLKLPQMGMMAVDAEIIRKLPSLLGEADVIKAIQMLPGVQSPSEGSTGFSVRGGGIDQNLVLMDGAPIYNCGHFLGFFSMFNGDVVKDAKLYKGDFPAKFGERVSSVLDVSTTDGDLDKIKGDLSLGLLTSKAMVEGPIVRSKLSFAVAARRSYLDLFFPIFKNSIPEKTKLSFYDVNAKLNWIINDKNRIQVSAFAGNDLFGLNAGDMGVSLMTFDYSNITQTIRWNHSFGQKFRTTLTAYNSLFIQGVDCDMEQSPFIWKSRIGETGLRNRYDWEINADNKMEFGIEAAYFRIRPSDTDPVGESIVQQIYSPPCYAVQPSAYIQNEQTLGPVTLRYGMRFTNHTTLGETDQYYYDPVTHEKTDEIHFGAWEAITSFWGLDPRFSASFSINPESSVKVSYIRTHQYLQQTSVSVSPGVLDAWFTASPNVKPVISDQVSLGYNMNFLDDALKATLEGFYKHNQNTADLKDNPGMVIDNPDRESLLRFGKSYAYGVEAMLEYNIKNVHGWIGYTWSRAIYDIPEINGGKPYRSPLNHEHAVNVVCTWDISKRVDLSGTWIFYSGSPTTFPTSRYSYGGNYLPIYSERNSDSMPDYHRADISLNLRSKKRVEGRRWSGEWNFSIYNLYGRHNAWSISTGYDVKEGTTGATLIYLFSVVPSVSYNLKF